jgi:hypothetical protein
MSVCVSNMAWPEGGIDEPKKRATAIANTAASNSTRIICNLLYSCVRKNIQKKPRMNNGPLYMSENSAVDDMLSHNNAHTAQIDTKAFGRRIQESPNPDVTL